MSDVILYGFPVSTYVNVARLVLTQKDVDYEFCNLAAEMGQPRHLKLHPFNRVPVLRHGDVELYETAAIATYVDERFGGPSLQPDGALQRARMHQWISALSSYYYPYIAFHLGHERLIYPNLGIAPDEKVVAVALPKIATALEVMERTLEQGSGYLVGDKPTLADFFLLPTMTSLSLTPEGPQMLSGKPAIVAWSQRMSALPSVVKVRADVAPFIGKPLEHARAWVDTHRPRY